MEFSSTEAYLRSFRIPLLEEVRAQLQQGLDKEQMAGHGVIAIQKVVKPNRNKEREEDKKYLVFRQPVHLPEMKCSDLVLFCSAKPWWDAQRQCLVKPDGGASARVRCRCE